jgi:predicted nucleotidyltransferase
MVIDSSLSISAEQVADFCHRHGIVELALFGSAARGELRPESDVDVMVTFAPDASWDLYDYAEMQSELELIFRRPVDLVEKGTIANPHRQRTITRDLTVLYAA